MESKITIKIKTIILIIFICLPALIYCQNLKINIYSAGVYDIPYGDFRNPDIYPENGNANDGVSFNLGSQVKVSDKVFIGVESAYYKFGPREKVANNKVYISLYSFVLNGSYYYQLNDFRPYISFGVGLSSTYLNVQTDFFEESSTKTVPFVNLTISSDMMIANHTAIFGFIRWNEAFIKNQNFKYDHFHTLTPKFNANFIGAGLGIKYWIY